MPKPSHTLDLTAYYGPSWTSSFDPHCTNIITGRKAGKSHHCYKCHTAPTRRCYTDLHMAYCIVRITHIDNSKLPIPSICGERFAIVSPGGCFTHPYDQDGEVNRVFERAMKGLDGSEPVGWAVAVVQERRDRDDRVNTKGAGDDGKWKQKGKPRVKTSVMRAQRKEVKEVKEKEKLGRKGKARK